MEEYANAAAATAGGGEVTSPHRREWVKVKSAERTVSAFVIIHEIFGMMDWIQLVIAIAPDLLFSVPLPPVGANAVGKAIRDLSPDQITADLNAVADYASKLPAANGKVAVAGFCWGGHAVVPLRDEPPGRVTASDLQIPAHTEL